MSFPARVAAVLIMLAAFVPAPLSAHDEFRFIGSVLTLDAAKNLVTVAYKEFDGKEDTVTVKILTTTKITRDHKAVSKTALRAGTHVVVDALGCDDDYDAVSIRIVQAPAK